MRFAFPICLVFGAYVYDGAETQVLLYVEPSQEKADRAIAEHKKKEHGFHYFRVLKVDNFGEVKRAT